MARRVKAKKSIDHATGALFPELPEPPSVSDLVELRNLPHPVWTENKAKLIARYLQLFTFVTKHGTYIDGFSGRQSDRANEGWAAELVLGLKPRRLRQFYLCEKSAIKTRGLQRLINGQPPRAKNDSKREIEVMRGDFNNLVQEILSSRKVERAAFCLLDQHTFECRWATVEALANYRQTGLKIELFYFLPIGWLNRAILVTKRNHAAIEAWWGRPDWERLVDMQHHEKAISFRDRFLELGYKYVLPLPILDRERGDRVMFYMILATDHEAAPKLMWRAYDQAVPDTKGWDQLEIGGL